MRFLCPLLPLPFLSTRAVAGPAMPVHWRPHALATYLPATVWLEAQHGLLHLSAGHEQWCVPIQSIRWRPRLLGRGWVACLALPASAQCLHAMAHAGHVLGLAPEQLGLNPPKPHGVWPLLHRLLVPLTITTVLSGVALAAL